MHMRDSYFPANNTVPQNVLTHLLTGVQHWFAFNEDKVLRDLLYETFLIIIRYNCRQTINVKPPFTLI